MAKCVTSERTHWTTVHLEGSIINLVGPFLFPIYGGGCDAKEVIKPNVRNGSQSSGLYVLAIDNSALTAANLLPTNNIGMMLHVTTI